MKRKNFSHQNGFGLAVYILKKDDFQPKPDAHRPLLKKDAVSTSFSSFPSY